MISDNAKTFKAASRAVASLLGMSAVRAFLSNLGIKWAFHVEEAPWWWVFLQENGPEVPEDSN